MWQRYNPNPIGSRVGDCTVRAISKVLNQRWDITYIWLCVYGFMLCDMPSANHIWGEFLRSRGFRRYAEENSCTVREFCRYHPDGCYVLALSGHVIAACGGDYFDTWDSGDEPVIYFWRKEE